MTVGFACDTYSRRWIELVGVLGPTRGTLVRRLHVMLEKIHYRFIMDHARRRRQMISVVLRDWIDQRMRSPRQCLLGQDPLWDMAGIARGGKEKFSESHDQYLVNARMKRMADRRRKKV